jgi:hypothetical protein
LATCIGHALLDAKWHCFGALCLMKSATPYRDGFPQWVQLTGVLGRNRPK